MIYTITLNPSIDYTVCLDSFTPGMTNRTTDEEYHIGGKGINVSCILSELGIKNKAVGFTAGFTGDAIEQELRLKGIETDFIRLKEGISRINIKLKAGEESEINCQGPHISDEEFNMLLHKTDMISDGDTLVIAGSVPKKLSDNSYEKILERLRGRNIHIIIDAAKKLLVNSLKYKPFLIKPNKQELSEVFGMEITSETDLEDCAEKLKNMGAKNVIVSLGGSGAVLFDETGRKHRSGVLNERVISTVGSGDSMVAGFIAGYEKTNDYSYAFTLGTACGNATAFSDGLATREKIDEILSKLQSK